MINRFKHLQMDLMRKVSYMINGHILNPFWYSRDKRRKIRRIALRNSILAYLRIYEDKIRDFCPAPLDTNEEPERVFSIWFQGEENAPDLVKACFRSMRRNLDLDLVVLDENTIFDWISLPDCVIEKWRKGIIPHTQFSDICRIELLYEHGGIWCDSTGYITSPIPRNVMDGNVFFFMSGETLGGWYAFMQNCFLRARKGNPLMGVWREAVFNFWKNENDMKNYYIHQLLLLMSINCNAIATGEFEKMPKIVQDPTHRVWFNHRNDQYDKDYFDLLTKDAFFQKTTYKSKDIDSLAKGTIGYHIIND